MLELFSVRFELSRAKCRLKVMILRMTEKLVEHRLSQMKIMNGKKKRKQEKIVFSQRKRWLFNF